MFCFLKYKYLVLLSAIKFGVTEQFFLLLTADRKHAVFYSSLSISNAPITLYH